MISEKVETYAYSCYERNFAPMLENCIFCSKEIVCCRVLVASGFIWLISYSDSAVCYIEIYSYAFGLPLLKCLCAMDRFHFPKEVLQHL